MSDRTHTPSADRRLWPHRGAVPTRLAIITLLSAGLVGALLGCPSSRDPRSSTPNTAASTRDSEAAPSSSTSAPRPELDPAVPDRFVFVFWNVANLFRPEETGPGQPSRVRALSPEAYGRKLAGLAKGLSVAGGGRPPPVVALAEVGSHGALSDLAARPEVSAAGYRAIRLEGPDRRGISNAVLTSLALRGLPRHHEVHGPGDPPTRAVLEVWLDTGDVPLVVFVNHWPSKRGREVARALRERVARRVFELVQRAAVEAPDAEIIVAGDFNAYLDERVFDPGYLASSAVETDVAASAGDLLFHTLDDAAEARFGRAIDDLDEIRSREAEAGFGTHVFERRWGTLDGVLVHSRLLDAKGLAYVPDSARIVRDPSLIYVVKRGRPDAYDKPDREISDHLPVAIELQRVAP